MSLNVCLADLLATKKISQATHDRMKPAYDELVAQFEPVHGRAAAESMATARVLDDMEVDLAVRQRQALLQTQAQGSWLKSMQAKAGVDDAGQARPIQAKDAADFIRTMDFDRQGIGEQAFGMMTDLLVKFRRNLVGVVRHKAELTEVLDELMGRDSGSANARELAEAWRRTAEWLRSRFNAHGGHIAKLEGWALPQLHDARSIADAGFEAWRDFVVPLLNREKMIDHATGLPMGDGKLEMLLRDMHAAIASNGWTRRSAGALGTTKLGNQRQAHRVLHFADGRSWQAYAERFGGRASAVDAMLGHVRSMARDIAAMQHMGPNPDATLRFQQDWLSKSGGEALASGAGRQGVGKIARVLKGSAADQLTANAAGGAGKLQRLFDEYSGKNSFSENPRMSMMFGALAAQQASAKLGGAFLRSQGDLGTMVATARFDGLPAGKMLARYAKLMAPGSQADRELAARLGVVTEQWTRALGGDFRQTGEEMTFELARRLSDFTMRASFLERHTESVQAAFGMELMNAVTMNRHLPLEQLDKGFAKMLRRHGITTAKWDMLRGTEVESHGGHDWILPAAIADESLRQDIHRMVIAEVRHAVTTSDLDTRARINSTFQRGTWFGEIGRSAFLFKGFPLTLLSLHGRRMMREGSTPAKLNYGFTLLALTTLGGALSQQLTSVRDGKDPEDMTAPGFWGRAMLSGGGLGIFGDLVKSSENRFGGGIAQTIVGPLLGNAASGMMELGIINPLIEGRNMMDRMAGREADEDPKWAKDALQFAKSETPALSLWYVRTAMERLLFDQAKEWADPEGYEASYRRMEQRAEDQDTSYFAPPGGRGDARDVDWGNMIGQPAAPENQARLEAQAAGN